MDVVIVTKKEGVLTHRVIAEELTSYYDDLGMRCERDAFDTLFDHAPDKLQVNILLIEQIDLFCIQGGEEESGNFC